ncbi:Capsule polysaccharide biosynthesis protein [Labrenzia sp. THAF82]|uniref:capsular polysaccharide export protein, LipB/KpsS family n=1 Tax=Labrenzia sp. THAF82 TaxID=2587861 RepID=UPI0012683E04|nr:hypothetical protein [Labrenzia sp. THAF82]QFT34379.1 Capsule polysaccharide biosynthesis protein [Labrenzia sp. THAF82]
MKIGLATSGLWRLRHVVEQKTSATATRHLPFGLGLDAIAGWGHKPTAAKARAAARQLQIPYIAFEDGFLRSIKPGDTEMPVGMVMDRTGIYYDSRQPSDMEAYINRRRSSECGSDIQQAIDALRTSRLSKYNHAMVNDLTGLALRSSDRCERVLVIDQTVGDASVPGAGADASSFEQMLKVAAAENPSAEILLRVHPETLLGRKSGHFNSDLVRLLANSDTALRRCQSEGRLRLTPEPVNPWALLEGCSRVYCVSSQLGFEAVLAGCEVHCFGMPFYGGWGLTRDRAVPAPHRRGPASLRAVFAGAYLDYSFYLDHTEQRFLSFSEAIELLSQRRNSDRRCVTLGWRIDAVPRTGVGYK